MKEYMPDFEKMLEDNLTFYTTSPEAILTKDLFQTHREISIARLALTNQAKCYAKAIEIFERLLDTISNQPSIEPQQLTSIMQMIYQIEQKSQHLIESSIKTVQLLKSAIDIDVDKSSLRTILVRLPSLVKESITQLGHPELAEQASFSLNNKLDQLFIALRFSDNPMQQQTDTGSLDMDQYRQMMESIPSSPPATLSNDQQTIQGAVVR